MDKFLRAEWFRKQSFETKTDGLAFIHQNEQLNKFLDDKTNDIEDFKQSKIDEFEEYFEKFGDEKEEYLIKAKVIRSERIEQKKEIQKKILKEEMKIEILKEIREEEEQKKKDNIKKTYPNMCPNYNKNEMSDINNIDELFMQIAIKDNLEKDDIANIEKMKDQVEKAFMILSKVSDKLTKMNNKK